MAASLDPSAILSQLTVSYLKLPLGQKILFPILIAASVIGIIYVSKWANRADYTVLYSDLSAADSAAVVEKLKSEKIAYEVRGDGSTIAISPPEVVPEVRMTLAADGIPKTGALGYEIFDSNNIGVTQFVEKLKFLRALQGELERTIGSLDVVMSARVHITQPEKTVFAKQAAQPTASVMLKLRPGGELEKKQVKGIANLVAGSVEGLKPEGVTIVDVFGNLLSVNDKDEDALGIEATRLQYQRDVEKSYVQRIESMLSKVLGAGKGIARVTADMDFSVNEREEESFDPGGQVLRSEKTVEEGAGASQRGGVPGVVSNLSNDPNLLAPQSGEQSNSNRKEAVKNYEVSRAVSKTSSARGKLMRLSVAVLVDGAYEAAPGAAADAPKVFKPLDSEVMNQIENLVKSAVGFDQIRGDTVTVENIPFHETDSALLKDLDNKAQQDLIFNIIGKTIPLLFVVLFFFVVVKPLVKFLVTPTEAEVDLSRLLPTGINELEQEIEQERAKAAVPVYEPQVDIEALEELMGENSKLVKDNPQQAALLIRYWLNDGRL